MAAVDHSLIVLAPLVVLLSLRHFLSLHVFAVDFRDAYWWGGRAILHGLSPYHRPAAQAATGNFFVYPPLAALVLAPLALVPAWVGGALFTVFCLVCLGLGMAAVGVRDWRVYAAVAIWSPVVTAWQTANLTLPLALGIALIWRHRNRPVVAGLLVALLVSIKPFVWPLGLWLLATRRYRAFIVAVIAAAVLNLLAFSVVGFDQLQPFLDANRAALDVLRGTAYGVKAIASAAGLGSTLGEAVMVAFSAIAAVACVRAGRADRERAGFSISVVLMLLASPVADFHYFALLAVPLAVARPRLTLAWLAPLVLWLCPAMGFVGWAGPLWWTLVIGVAVVAAATGRAGRRSVQAPVPAPTGPLQAL
jgi:alpha-1,2-mannosyltransferase